MTDEELIVKFLAGNTAAFNTLVWRWQKPIFNFIMRYIGDADKAKDVMQQTFIRAYQNLPKLRQKGKFTTWLFQIAVNQCKTELLQSKRTYIPIDHIHAHPEGNRSGNDPQHVLKTKDNSMGNQAELSRILNQALQSIPSEQRIVVIMKNYHELKFWEIAEILKEPLNTIKSRLYYGLRAMRKVLEDWGLNQEDFSYEM